MKTKNISGCNIKKLHERLYRSHRTLLRSAWEFLPDIGNLIPTKVIHLNNWPSCHTDHQEAIFVAPEVNLKGYIPHMPSPSSNKAAHFGFGTQTRHLWKSKKCGIYHKIIDLCLKMVRRRGCYFGQSKTDVRCFPITTHYEFLEIYYLWMCAVIRETTF